MQRFFVLIWVLLVAAVGIAAAVYLGTHKNSPDSPKATINSYAECVKAGYPVQQSYPAVCKTPDGQKYIQTIPNKTQPQNPTSTLTKDQAQILIDSCQADGIYALHNGEAGLVIKNGSMIPVAGATSTYLDEHQNPTCPYTKRLIE